MTFRPRKDGVLGAEALVAASASHLRHGVRHLTWGRSVGPRGYVSLYSGPLPPSGGVSRPPFAVIAPHWTQFDGVTSTWPSRASYTWAGHICSHMTAISSGTSVRTRMWFDASSRVR